MREFEPSQSASGAARVEPEAQVVALLQRCAQRDARALRELYDLTAPMLLGCVQRIARRRALAEEILQDVYLRIWERADAFDEYRGRAHAWLISIARYRAIDVVRRERVMPIDPVMATETLDRERGAQSNGNDTGGDGAEITHAPRLEECLDALQGEQRRSLQLAFVDGRSHPEIATLLDRPLGSVKSWIRRGLAALKACLQS